ncbi:MAG: hypothetical protein V2I37_01915 [Marinilabiliaceae bacterium]|jgi:hypothetical protein|nr:hypothetical protein [Marinilabiliaceae bacterium]
MTIDNAKTIISLRLRTFAVTVLLLFWIFFAYLEKGLKFPLWGLDIGMWTFLVLFTYILVIFYPVLLKYRYIYFSDDGPSIVFRFYAAGAFKGKRNSYEIPKGEFAGYEIKNYGPGLKMIVLKRRSDRKVAMYPPVHLGSLKAKELNIIKESLDKAKLN